MSKRIHHDSHVYFAQEFHPDSSLIPRGVCIVCKNHLDHPDQHEILFPNQSNGYYSNHYPRKNFVELKSLSQDMQEAEGKCQISPPNPHLPGQDQRIEKEIISQRLARQSKNTF